MGADIPAENTPNASKDFSSKYQPNPKYSKFLKKSSLRVSVVRVWNYNNTHCHRHYHRLLLLERAVELRAAEKGGQGVTCPSRFFDRFRNKLFFFKRPFRPTRFSELLTALKLLLVLAQNASLTPARRHKCQFGCGVSIFWSKISTFKGPSIKDVGIF